jgi:phosphatidylinositol alpha 1,6-mannosyltransferase
MRANVPRVAYFPDGFHEINGVAHTSRHFESYARRHDLPFLCVRAGTREPAYLEEGNVATMELRRGACSFPLENDLRFDLGFWRHESQVLEVLRRFKPDVLHITGPSDVGMVGMWVASRMRVPLVASWHTNVHEYAARRAARFTRVFGSGSAAVERRIEASSLWLTACFYRRARTLFAPNPQLCRVLEQATRRRCYLMTRGVDTEAFSPAHRDRAPDDHDFVLGFVGRLSIEKNVALLADVQKQLLVAGHTNFRFLIVGHGKEEAWLRQRLPRAEFPGVLRGAGLARAFANMDAFVFPSHTDTFGNVVLEALASGVPAVVTPDGGPAGIVKDGETGFVVDDDAFAPTIARLMNDCKLHRCLATSARAYALSRSWDAVFDAVYAAYATVLAT